MGAINVQRVSDGIWRVWVDGQELSRVVAVEFDWPVHYGNPVATIKLYPHEFTVLSNEEDMVGVDLTDKPGCGFKAGKP